MKNLSKKILTYGGECLPGDSIRALELIADADSDAGAVCLAEMGLQTARAYLRSAMGDDDAEPAYTAAEMSAQAVVCLVHGDEDGAQRALDGEDVVS